MKILATFIVCFCFSISIFAQHENVGIGTTTPDSSAVLDITTTDKGVLLPRMDSIHRENIINPKDGLILYDSTTLSFWFFRDTVWTEFHWEEVDNLGNHIAMQDLDMNGLLIKNLEFPINPGDAVNLEYVNNLTSDLQNDINNNEASIDDLQDQIDDHTNDIADNSTTIENHLTNDNDLSPTNELQMLSIVGQNLTLSSGNTITLPSNTGVFENISGVVRNTGANTNDFVFGDSLLPPIGINVTERLIFFDEDKGAFRAGRLLNSDVWGPDKIGNQSIAFGLNPEASGLNSIAIGDKTVASENHSVAIGNSASATDENAIAIGSLTNASGSGSVAIGSNSNAPGTNSVALGRSVKAVGNESLSTGNDTEANGLNSVAMGYKSEGNGDYSTALGWQTQANGAYSTTAGIGTRAGSYGSTAIGRYNVITGDGANWISTDPIFEIGIGALSTSRENALTILKDGTVSFKEYTFPNYDGTLNQVLRSNGNGNLYWIDLPNAGLFEISGSAIYAPSSIYYNFIYGSDKLPETDSLSVGDMFFLNHSRAAFRAGRLTSSVNWGTDSLGIGSFGAGINVLASGARSVAFGSESKAQGDASFSMGYNTVSTGFGAVSFGLNSSAFGDYATAMGDGAIAHAAFAIAMGEHPHAYEHAVSLGNHTQAKYGTTAFGRYNTGYGSTIDWIETDPLFEIGNGTDGANRSNALTILKNGTVSFEHYTFPDTDGTTDQVLKTDGSGSLSWSDQTGGGAFENNAGVVRNTGSTNDDFVFGSNELPQNGINASDTLFFLDKNKAAFRFGILDNSTNWSPDSMGTGSYAFGLNALAKGDASVSIGFLTQARGTLSMAQGSGTIADAQHAIAMGYQSQALGSTSIALGHSNIAWGDQSIVTGQYAEAKGVLSTAMGHRVIADAYNSMAIGRFNEGGGNQTSWVGTDPVFEVGIGMDAANKKNALTIQKNGTVSLKNYTFPTADGSAHQVMQTDGSGNLNWADQTPEVFENVMGVVRSTGANSDDFVFGAIGLPPNGTQVTASLFFFDDSKGAFRAGYLDDSNNWSSNNIGDYSTAFGSSTEASGTYSFASGYRSKATAAYSTAMGSSTDATGNFSTALGSSTLASGNYSLAMGQNTEASGSYSVAMGYTTHATGPLSIATGLSTWAIGERSMTLGKWTDALGENSLAMGLGSEASGENSVAMGSYTNAHAKSSLAIGRFNVGGGDSLLWVSTDPLFEIGIGISGNNQNALTVYKNGRSVFTEDVEVEGALSVGNGVSSLLHLGFLTFECVSSNIMAIDANFRPSEDDMFDLGAAGKRWDDVFATNGVIQTSDKRLKKNITPLAYGLNAVLKLQPVQYNWNNEKNAQKQHVGLIAQDLLELIPEVVHVPENTEEYLGVKYAELVPVLINAIQEQNELLTQQENTISTIQNELEELKAMVSILYQDNETAQNKGLQANK